MKKLLGLSVSILLAFMFLLVACNTNTYFYPEEHIIIVRMGKDTGNVSSWKAVFQAIVDKIGI
ncbi:MAG: hypothetical protein OEU76_03965 [Cyclobacteriaceae bacterium]|nr:hypothetical protein [Cyclobacteriaceae bacterium]